LQDECSQPRIRRIKSLTIHGEGRRGGQSLVASGQTKCNHKHSVKSVWCRAAHMGGGRVRCVSGRGREGASSDEGEYPLTKAGTRKEETCIERQCQVNLPGKNAIGVGWGKRDRRPSGMKWGNSCRVGGSRRGTRRTPKGTAGQGRREVPTIKEDH